MLRLFCIFSALGISLFLTSCYTISKKDCLAGDWKGIGFTDGFNGYLPKERFEGHTKSCKRVKVVPDLTLWKQGYKKGLLRYCTAGSGLWEGQHGHSYNGLCPPQTEAEFLRGHVIGYRQYALRSKLERLEDNYKRKEEELEELQEKMKKDRNEEYSLLNYWKVKDLKEDLSDIRDEEDRVRDDLSEADQQVRLFESQL
ncbi:hypothetical protein ATY76_02425 [Rhizobium sp. R339]|uniref:DUF2799 domain-containing protein n=1 Tax=Rhizobium sp. R339 TaxID=1764273 RepID=UPI000B534310|nr:DUF2799 domain-containing protein [Rhizobium sp. R339]OWV76826.1 hypothetical protein ATY76_02425 [Rhizobium sp. R339]